MTDTNKCNEKNRCCLHWSHLLHGAPEPDECCDFCLKAIRNSSEEM